MKKIVKWYEVLKSNDVEIKLSPQEDSEEETSEDKDLAQAEETVTLEVSGDDTAETAKPKAKRKKKEEKEN
jgi:hypothetical protein